MTPFHAYEWLDLAATMTGTTFLPLVVTSAGRDIGVAPRLTRRRVGAGLVNWVPFPYVGPLVAHDLLGATLDASGTYDCRNAVIRQQQSFPPGALIDVDALVRRGFHVQHDPTYIVDTDRSEEQMWTALDGRCRTKIRRAEREGVHVEVATDGEMLRDAVDAAFGARDLASGYRDNFPPDPARTAALNLSVRFVEARLDGRPVGSLVSLAAGPFALMWQGGVLPQYRSTHANVLLYWDSIRWAHQVGARSIDLVGIPDPGIGRFKSQFGGRLAEYVVARRQSHIGRAIERMQRQTMKSS
jgi:hypothetical protein